MFVFKKTTLILVAMFIALGLVTAAFGPAAAAAPVDCRQWHTVQGGEYLTMIARTYSVNWRTLVDTNSLPDPNIIFPGQRLCVSAPGILSITTPVVVSPVAGASGTDGRVYAVSVTEDKSVTLQAKGLTANSLYFISMSNFRAKLALPFSAGTITTDSSGAFRATFDIPKNLKDVLKIKVTAYNLRGDASSNWFINGTMEGNTGGVNAASFDFSIQAVDKGDWVKIKTSNLPANVTFTVYMSREGKRGVDGIKVGTLRHSKGGSITFTFDIPDDLEGRSKIDLRVENEPLNIFAYHTFENVNSK